MRRLSMTYLPFTGLSVRCFPFLGVLFVVEIGIMSLSGVTQLNRTSHDYLVLKRVTSF